MMNLDQIKKTMSSTAKESLQTLNKLREDIAAINEEIHWIENSPLPEADVNLRITQYVDSFKNLENITSFMNPSAAAGSRCFEVFSKPNSEEMGVTVFGEKGIITGGLRVDITGILCSIFPDLVKTSLKNLAKLKANELTIGPALSERPKLKAEALLRRKALEIEEEKLIEMAEELGLVGFYRRADVDPAIVLMMGDA